MDLDNDGLITPQELQDALRFLKSNLDDGDLMALLERLVVELCVAGAADAYHALAEACHLQGSYDSPVCIITSLLCHYALQARELGLL